MPLAALESFAPLSSAPWDFDQFWAATRGRVLDVRAELVTARQQSPRAGLSHDKLSFKSLGHVPVAGYLLTHDVAEPRPLVIHSHGYNAQYDVMLNWANTGCHVMGIDFRGFGRSPQIPLARGGYILTGIESPQKSILRGAVADLLQAIETARTLLSWRVSSITLYGFSFGGAIALMAGSLEKNLDLIVVGQPTLGWHSERLRLSTAGSSAEINRFLAEHPGERDAAMKTLDYFDTLHFAARTTTPTFVGVGLDDDVVPSRSVIAVTNNVATPQLELRILPVAHSVDPRESLWSRFDDEWLALTRNGLPADFGAADRQVLAIE